MRKLIVTTIVTLDGYVAGPGNDVYAMPMDHAFDESNLDLHAHLRHGAVRRHHLPRVRRLLAARGRQPGVRRPPQRRDRRTLARPARRSWSPTPSLAADTGPWRDPTLIVPRAEAHAAVADLREGDADQGDIVIWGSRTLWNDLLAAGLVDELHLMVGPVALGGGTPAFGDGVTTAGLRLTGVRRWEGSENVLLSYDA